MYQISYKKTTKYYTDGETLLILLANLTNLPLYSIK